MVFASFKNSKANLVQDTPLSTSLTMAEGNYVLVLNNPVIAVKLGKVSVRVIGKKPKAAVLGERQLIKGDTPKQADVDRIFGQALITAGKVK